MAIISIFLMLLIAQVSLPHSLTSRIINGMDASPNQFPFLAFIELGFPPLVPFTYECIGIPYDEYHIITIANCAKKVTTTMHARVKIGVHFMKHNNDSVEIYEVANTIIHEDYISSSVPKSNDIALMILKTAITNPTIVKLSKQKSPQGGVWIAGWGKTSTIPIIGTPSVLQYASLVIISNQFCQTVVSKLHKVPIIQDTQICIYTPTSATSGYLGDGGGPVIQYYNGEPEVVGIMSFTAYPEMKMGTVTISTRIFHYTQWLKNKVQKQPNIDPDSNMLTPLLVS